MIQKPLLIVLFVSILLNVRAQAWVELGTGTSALNANYDIEAICSDPSGNIYASGVFYNSNGYSYVAKWNGSSWSELGVGPNALNANNRISALCSDPSGKIYAAGYFNKSVLINNVSYVVSYVAVWNGTSWSELGGGAGALNANSSIFALHRDASGNIYAAGSFDTGGNGKYYVAKWDGTSWSELGTGANALNANYFIHLLSSDAMGNIYASGGFTNSSGKQYVAKWDGTSWSELGGANSLNAGNWIRSMFSDASGNVYAAGDFENSQFRMYVAKWNGTSWSELGTGSASLKANNGIYSICQDASGNIYAGGKFTNSNLKIYVAKWNGTTWSQVGTDPVGYGSSTRIQCLHSTNGMVYAGGTFTDLNNKISVVQNSTTTTGVLHSTSYPIDLYPNPVKNDLILEVPENGQLTIYNSMGEVVLMQNVVKGNTILSLDEFETGIFTVFLRGENNFYSSTKIIKN